MFTQSTGVISSASNDDMANANSIIDKHVDLQKEDLSQNPILVKDNEAFVPLYSEAEELHASSVEAKLCVSIDDSKATVKQRKKKRTAAQLAEVNRVIFKLYNEGFSENAIAKKVSISEEYVGKQILNQLRQGNLEPVQTIYEIVTGCTSIKKIAEVFGIRIFAEDLCEVEMQGANLIIKHDKPAHKAEGESYE